MKPLQHYWYHSNYLVWLLLPISWFYCLIATLRRKLYQLGIKKSYTSQLPVVVIGNIVAGGSGKTPLLISLCEYIQANGYNPGVVSRGYGGNVSGVYQVSENDSAEMVGDEPLMIFQRTMVPVVVGADRVAAVEYLVKNNRCDIVLSDDGLQHYRMRRDFEIAVIDSSRKFGNGFCLPAGPLRERKSRLNDVNMRVYNDTDATAADECSYKLQVVCLNQLNNSEKNRPLSSFSKRPVHAVAGIGHPLRFFEQLNQAGVKTINHAFPDHHVYEQEDFSGWDQECIIMTEKDAVKCRHLFLPDAWVLIVKAIFSDVLESRLSAEVLPLLNR
ncbi:MAG: tetraacyldisaccharide 4'-kinase [Gammaproteobacteria bacterium]